VLTVAATAGVAAGAEDEEEDGLDEAEDDEDDDDDDVVVTDDVSDVELPHAAMSRTPPPISSRRAVNLAMVASN
jgi:hypothetical protein